MRFGLLRVAALVCFCGAVAPAQQAVTVRQLVDFITSSISQKQPDKDVASTLMGMKMSERLTPGMVEDLQGKGAGPRTVAALNRMAEASASLTAAAPKVEPPKPKPIPPPPYEEQQKILAEARDYAINYSKTLPDFLCLQRTHRYVDRNFKPGSEGSWSPSDRIVAKLSYFDQREKYDLISDNDNALVGKKYESVGGSISTGEFGSVLKDIFDPGSAAEFHWERWATVRGQLAHVYTYVIDQPHARRTVEYNHDQQTTPGYHGEVFIVKGANTVVRLTVEPEMPSGFPIQEIHETIDYSYVDISGQKFWLPLKSDLIMRNDRNGSRNEIDWSSYRKYSADTSITFDDTDDPPAADGSTAPAPTAPGAPAHPPH
jgi:hypothetical protein